MFVHSPGSVKNNITTNAVAWGEPKTIMANQLAVEIKYQQPCKTDTEPWIASLNHCSYKIWVNNIVTIEFLSKEREEDREVDWTFTLCQHALQLLIRYIQLPCSVQQDDTVSTS